METKLEIQAVLEEPQEKLTKLKRRKIELADIPGSHWYHVEGVKEPLPSVTTILNAYPKGIDFAKWLGNADSFEAAEKIKQDAGERGTRVHSGIQSLTEEMTLKKEDYSVEEWKMLMSFVNWVEDYDPAIEEMEMPLYSLKERFAGRCDCLCFIEGELTLVDFKTSKALYKNYQLQLQAYAGALKEMGVKVKRLGLLRVGSKHKRGYEFKVFEPTPYGYNSFKAVRAVWEFDTGGQPPEREVLPMELSLISIPNTPDENVS